MSSYLCSVPKVSYHLSQINCWLVVMGHRGPLRLADLCKLYNEDSVHTLCSLFEHEWKKQQNYYERLNPEEESGRETLLFSSNTFSGYSLLYAILKTFRPNLIKVVLLRLSTDLLGILGPLTLRWVILFCERQPVFDWVGYTYSLVVLGAVFCSAVSKYQLERHSRVTIANAQAVLADTLYRKVKTLSLSHRSQMQSNTTDADTLLSVEVERVAGLGVTLACLWSSPLRVALYLSLLWRELGPGVLVGAVLLIVLISVRSAVERKVKQLRRSQEIIRERSEQLIKEMLHKLQALKFLAWEPWFHQRVSESRASELEILQILRYLTAFSMLDSICMPFLVSFSGLGFFVLVDDGNVLTPSQIFSCLCYFRLLRLPLLELPAHFSGLKQAQQSLCNLEKVFLSKDLGTAQLVTTEGTTEELPPDSSQQQCHRCKRDKHSDSDEARDHQLFQKGSGEARRLYLSAFGWHWVACYSVGFLCVCAVCIAQDGVLSVWTGEAKEVQGLEEWRELRNSRLSVCGLLGLLQAMLVCCSAYCQTRGSLRASDSLHSELLSDILHLPVHTAQTTDTKHLLHTFTQDMQVIDEKLPIHLHSWLWSLLEILSTITVICFIMPIFSLAVCPLIILFLHIQSHFSLAHIQIRPMETNPIVSVTSHKEVCQQHWLLPMNQNLLVKYNRTITESWFVLQLDAVAGIVLFLISLVLLQTQPNSGLVALVLISAFKVREPLHRYSQAASDVDIDLLSIQRVSEFAKMDKEAAWRVTYSAPFDWPQQGEVKFRNYECEAPFTPTIRGLNLIILKGEKIGVVSTEKADTDHLVNCLFRAVEASSGAVLIDGVNIACVGLHDLRSRLQIISQVPVLFSGPLRANLDPFTRHTDAQVWLALEHCHLKEQVRQLPAQLLHPTQRTSFVLSLGQRRLLCLARAMLERVKILLVQEAPPCVDLATEHLAQQLIHTEFKDCTVLWLTQNPLTVMHTDRVLVLKKGQALKFDAPSTLLQQRLLSQ
ncbi:multidrug resistance-associated protein 1 [Xyrauchen texanus]|uniref:multidrug resistance-associated protein 1 n=1 Tax=Xyrauchen texanus TaxID=154827 RepID=UPI0022427D2F|nr:multidrug resistance-associated protein 1 [Xyrauchen texanus]